MEDITKSPCNKRRKLNTTLSEKVGTFNENKTALAKSTSGKLGIRNYFISSKHQPDSLSGRIANGHSDKRVLNSKVGKNVRVFPNHKK